MFNEKQINLLESLGVPNTYWKDRTYEYHYWFRALLQKLDSSLIFDGLPENWSKDFFLFCLWAFGYVTVFNTEQWGTIFQPSTLSGYDIFYQPTKSLVANPLYQNELTIHEDCELLKLTPDFKGVFDIIDYYASKLAELSKGIDVGIINTKMPIILTAANPAQAETLKKVYDKMQQGDSLIVYKEYKDFEEVIPRKDPFETWTQDFKETYIVTDLLNDFQTILNNFYVEIGLPVAIEKKAHVLDQEADFMAAQSQARLACWNMTLNESLLYVNKKFNLNITVRSARDTNEDIDILDGDDEDR